MSKGRTRRQVLALTGAAAGALAGCVGGDDSGTDDDGSEGTTDDSAGDSEEMGDDGGNGGAGSDGETSMDRPGWQTTTLEDVTTGETFTIAEFDRPVVVHTFATWCPKCASQQEKIDAFLEEAGGSAVAVDLTIDENDDPQKLRQHADSHGFDWRFGVSPSEMTGQLVEEFGREVASAPRSPVILVCPGGDAHAFDKGIGAGELQSRIQDSC